MEFTGERFLPEVPGDIALEHRHRYLQAAIYAQGKDVLDIASGEGYGSAILSNAAKSVVGVDISPEAVAHAKQKYAAHNLEFRVGSAAAIPLPDASVDLVVSFETIEHHDQHEEMLREIKRVLRPGGVLCISSPDHYEYSIVPGYENEFHTKELTREEFEALLARHFANYKITGQRVVYGSVFVVDDEPANFLSWNAGSVIQTHTKGLPHAVYLIALASDGELPEASSGLLEGRVEDSDLCKLLRDRTEGLSTEVFSLKSYIQSLDNKLALSNKELALSLDRARSLEDTLNSLLQSRSWKITRPLRAAVNFYRRFKRAAPVLIKAVEPRNTPEPAGQSFTDSVVRERVQAYKAGTSAPPARVGDVRVYVAARGNHFFLEIAQLIRGGFTDIGIQATVVIAETFDDCANSEHAGADLHIIVAPHELFHFIPEAMAWPHAKGKKWILNTEQAHTSWFAKAKASFHMADLVLDMDQEMAMRLSREGFRAEHLPLGFSDNCRIFDGAGAIGLNDATAGIPKRIREWTDPGEPLAAALQARPLDYCFFGADTERRNEFFARNAALFARLEGYLLLKPLTGPLRLGKNTSLSTENTSSIIRRSKVSLNIHQSEYRYFEWHRIILQGIWQGALVLSEPCTAAMPFRPNIDYISMDIDHLADTLEYLLLSEEGNIFAERVRRQAYATLTEQCRLGDRLRDLLRTYIGIAEDYA